MIRSSLLYSKTHIFVKVLFGEKKKQNFSLPIGNFLIGYYLDFLSLEKKKDEKVILSNKMINI